MKITVRFSILFMVSLLIIVSASTILIVSFYLGKKSTDALSGNLIKLVSESVITNTLSYLEPAVKAVTFDRELSESLLLDKMFATDSIITNDNYLLNKIEKLSNFYNSNNLNEYNLSRQKIKELLKIQKKIYIVDYLIDIIDTNNQIVNAYYGDVNGDFVMVKKMPDKTISVKYVFRYQIDNYDKEIAVTVWDHKTDSYYTNGFKNVVELSSKAYNPTKRTWFIGAEQQFNEAKELDTIPKAYWSNPYVFSSDQVPGITCAMPIADAKGNLKRVLGLDLGIIQISKEYLANLKVGKTGKVFILNNKAEIFAYVPDITDEIIDKEEREKLINEQLKILIKEKPLYGDPNDKEKITGYKYTLTPIEELSDQVYRKAFLESGIEPTVKDEVKYYNLNETKQFKFRFEKIPYIGVFVPFPKNSSLEWIAGIIVPEDDFMGLVKKNTLITVIISIIALVISVILAIFISRLISKPIEIMVKETDKIKRFELDNPIKIKTLFSELNNMGDAFYSMELGLSSFEKYVPADLVRYLIHSGQEATLGGENKTLTVYFSDIADFTTVSESLNPEKLVEALGEYLGEMSDIIKKNKGTLDKYIGDAIMAFWGAPKECPDHAYLACKAAIENQEMLKQLRESRWLKENKPLFKSRIGLNTGELIVGNMGSKKRLNYTVIGDTVNLSSRLESINKYYNTEIMCGESTYKIIKDKIVTRKLDIVAVKGKKQGVGIYEIIGFKNQIDPKMESFISKYEEGLENYFNRSFKSAVKLFRESLSILNNDYPAKILTKRCETFLHEPPPVDWNGVYVFLRK